ncbi:MAG: AMP-binding protein [bacterium]|nr:AMP-binding protein [bacterium]
MTLVNTVPSAMAELVREGLPGSVGTVNLAGEALSGTLVEEVYRQESVTKVYNLYGPSEDTTYSTWSLVPRGESTPTIGRPVTGTQLFLADGNLQLVPVGLSGEILLGGEGLARGYHGQPALSAECWIPDPLSGRIGSRLYRTGDLGRYRADGEIEFLGRIDHQVKVRGYRIELGEIEAVLGKHEAVREAVVVARESAGGPQLVGYAVPTGGALPPVYDLRAFLSEQLPAFMVPQVFVGLDQLPRTPNGKVDRAALGRRALPSPYPAGAAASESEFVAPSTAVEQMLADIWREVLGAIPSWRPESCHGYARRSVPSCPSARCSKRPPSSACRRRSPRSCWHRPIPRRWPR